MQQVVSLRIDCDGDCLLAQVIQNGGGACHTGNVAAFYAAPANRRTRRAAILYRAGCRHPTTVGNTLKRELYQYLFDQGIDKILKRWAKRARRPSLRPRTTCRMRYHTRPAICSTMFWSCCKIGACRLIQHLCRAAPKKKINLKISLDRLAGLRYNHQASLREREHSSAGRALALQARGHWFEPSCSHQMAR